MVYKLTTILAKIGYPPLHLITSVSAIGSLIPYEIQRINKKKMTKMIMKNHLRKRIILNRTLQGKVVIEIKHEKGVSPGILLDCDAFCLVHCFRKGPLL